MCVFLNGENKMEKKQNKKQKNEKRKKKRNWAPVLKSIVFHHGSNDSVSRGGTRCVRAAIQHGRRVGEQ